MRRNLCVFEAVLLSLLVFASPSFGNNSAQGKTQPNLSSSEFNIDKYLREQSRLVPNPMNTWLEKKMEDDIRRAVRTGVALGSFGVNPSYLGAASLIAHNFCPVGFDIITLPGDIGNNNFYTRALEAALSGNIFNDRNPITHSKTVDLSRSLDDGFSRVNRTGTASIEKTFRPDPTLFRTNAYPWGTYQTQKTLLTPCTILETRGVNDIQAFQRQWFSTPYQNYSPVFNPYIQRPQIYTPMRPVYIPPPVRINR